MYDSIFLLLAKGATVKIGDNFVFTSGNGINPISRNIRGKIYVEENGYLEIGNNTGISSACIRVNEKIIIGDNVRIGGDCVLMDTDSHSLDWRVRAGLVIDPSTGKPVPDMKSANSKPIIIEDNVLIGARAIILKGVTIGARSIIGAGSVVSKSIPPDCIAAGNPCKVIKNFKSE